MDILKNYHFISVYSSFLVSYLLFFLTLIFSPILSVKLSEVCTFHPRLLISALLILHFFILLFASILIQSPIFLLFLYACTLLVDLYLISYLTSAQMSMLSCYHLLFNEWLVQQRLILFLKMVDLPLSPLYRIDNKHLLQIYAYLFLIFSCASEECHFAKYPLYWLTYQSISYFSFVKFQLIAYHRYS